MNHQPEANSGQHLLLASKRVDWSILHEGLTIPIRNHEAVNNSFRTHLKPGEKLAVKLKLDGRVYQAILTNVGFSRDKYPEHSDILQIRWTKNSPLAKHIRQVFAYSFQTLEAYRKLSTPADKPAIEESMNLIYNPAEQAIDFEYISADEIGLAKRQIKDDREEVVEFQQNYFKTDTNSSIEKVPTLAKIRRMDRSIIADLKQLYDFHCQICGLSFEIYDTRFIEAHHIEAFVTSLNNNSDNIMVICPNHHRVIHATKAEFRYPDLSIIYPNGLIEKLMTNRHLGASMQA